SQAQVSSLIQNQEAARRNVIENIQVQYQQFVSAKDRETSLVAAVAGAQLVVSSYRRQFIAGRKSWLEVLNAVREHNDYQVQLVQTRAEMLGAFYRLQVDFGLMQWQQFSHNRQPVTLFSPTNSVKQWLNKQEDSSNMSHEFGYGDNIAEEDYIEIRLPATAERDLDNGHYLMLNEDYSITPI
ncbi:TolC family protein, partial [Psychrobacter sp. 1Y4]|uniref:TolC family protein n=1 Tax=Psychrobacter sp. 1Y4 TaxID=3453575 RepID=UPI003F45F9EE